MTDKEIVLFILRYLEAGNTQADEHILIDVPVDLRWEKFVDALQAIENQGFLCLGYACTEVALWNAYVSPIGRAFIQDNTPEPLMRTIRRRTFHLIEVVFIAAISSAVSTAVGIFLTLYLMGKFG